MGKMKNIAIDMYNTNEDMDLETYQTQQEELKRMQKEIELEQSDDLDNYDNEVEDSNDPWNVD